MSVTPSGTPRDTNGEGRWRLQQVERAAATLQSEVAAMSQSFAVHRSETSIFIAMSKERWQEDDKRRREREREWDDWRGEQEDKIERTRKLATAAMGAMTAAALSGIATVLILLAER